mmetsp:Transcript_12776/g.16375  ORF Transcript_12776/g.16375 Transcript_12776/m.16375 type:complete len:127 (+) Transcript_12776:3500-3880(+)
MAPRQPRRRNRKKGAGRKRNSFYDNQEAAAASSTESEEEKKDAPEKPEPESAASATDSDKGGADPAPKDPPAAMNGYSMQLYGASELFAQLQAENGLARKKWTPKHRHREDEAELDLNETFAYTPQ